MVLDELKGQLFDIAIYRNFDFSQLIALDYIFNRLPGSQFVFASHVILLSFILAIVGIYLGVIKNRSKKVVVPVKKFYSKIANLLYILSAYGFLYVFLRKQSVAIFSSRFMLILWGILIIAVVVYAFIYKSKKLPTDIEKYWAFQTRQKYIPKKKR